ncbi:MAG: lipopolysaccharide transport periplasmic protein LptA [Candidatus Methylomirabilia bacterium]
MRGGTLSSVLVGLLSVGLAEGSLGVVAAAGARPSTGLESNPAKARGTEPSGSPSPKREGKSEPVVVDADRMESFKKEGLVIFSGNVVARQNNAVHYADRMEVYLDERGERVIRTVSTGNVRVITPDCQIGTARRAEHYEADQRVVLIGEARVWQGDNVISGERITLYLAEERSIIEAGQAGRVKAVLSSRPRERRASARGATPCPE